MDTSFGIRARPNMPSRSHALRDPVTVREAVDTELGPAKSVTPAADDGTKRDSGRRDEAPVRESLLDPQSQDALLHAANLEGDPAGPLPNQALIRQRAYRRQMPHDGEAADDTPGSDPHADIEA